MPRRTHAIVASLVLLATLLPTAPALGGVTPTVHYVDDDGCSDATGDSSVQPYCTIQAAVDASNPGGTINVAAGTYTDTSTYVVDVDVAVEINGAGSVGTIVDGQNARTVFRVAATGVTIKNLKIQNGAGSNGGGIAVAGGSNVTIESVTIADSTASSSGGGMWVAPGTTVVVDTVLFQDNVAASVGGGLLLTPTSGVTNVTITGSSFSANEAASGGAIAASGNSGTGTLDIDGTTFFNNDAQNSGGAIYLNSDSITTTVDDSTFSGNGSDFQGGADDVNGGGAINHQDGSLTIRTSLLSGNVADSGGGLYSQGGADLTIRNSTVSGNTGNTGGGGIFLTAGGTVIENTTIVDNTSTLVGGLRAAVGNRPTVRNSIIAGNSDGGTNPDCNYLTSAGHNLIEDTTGCVIDGNTTGDITGTDPQLVALADNGGPTETHAFTDGAPPHEAGNPAVPGSGGDACLSTDQRGVVRASYGQCDIGAFELESAPEPVVTRLAGSDRFSTAAEIAQEFWPGTSGTVIVANGLGFPDALTGSNLYGLGAPLLLVTSSSIPDATADELDRLDPDTIYILGGTAVVGSSVESNLGAWGTVERLAGANRYATAVEITQEAFPTGVDVVLIASGVNFPDALAGGAAAAKLGGALLITDPNTLPTEIEAEIERLDPDLIWILGGTAAVSTDVEDALELLAPQVDRIAGANRFQTAAFICAEFFNTADAVLTATGLNYPDALTGALAAGGASPVMLISTSSVPNDVETEIVSVGATTVYVLGGTAVIDGTAFAALESILGL